MEEHASDLRAVMPVQDPAVRRRNWKEVELGFAKDACQEGVPSLSALRHGQVARER